MLLKGHILLLSSFSLFSFFIVLTLPPLTFTCTLFNTSSITYFPPYLFCLITPLLRAFFKRQVSKSSQKARPCWRSLAILSFLSLSFCFRVNSLLCFPSSHSLLMFAPWVLWVVTCLLLGDQINAQLPPCNVAGPDFATSDSCEIQAGSYSFDSFVVSGYGMLLSLILD